jgi:hypothetical protein
VNEGQKAGRDAPRQREALPGVKQQNIERSRRDRGRSGCG